jgi:hypothetical protein
MAPSPKRSKQERTSINTARYQTLLPLFDELEGERLIVRPYRESDARDLFDAIKE